MIRIRQIKVPILEEQTLQDKIAKQLRVNKQDIKNITIIKKSLDARKKDNLFYVFGLDI